MGIGAFTDKARQPTDAEIAAAIGDKMPLWEALIRHLRETYAVQEDVKFLYGQKYGWARRFRVKSQALTALFPAEGSFAAQANLSEAAIARAQQEGLGENALRAISRAQPYPEGRWLFVTVESEADLRDAQRLIAWRAQEKRLR